jgi:hypothetical protein
MYVPLHLLIQLAKGNKALPIIASELKFNKKIINTIRIPVKITDT